MSVKRVSIIRCPGVRIRGVMKRNRGKYMWTCAVLEARPKKKDGTYTWRILELEGRAYWSDCPGPRGKLYRYATEMSSRFGILFESGLTRGGSESLCSLELLADIAKGVS